MNDWGVQQLGACGGCWVVTDRVVSQHDDGVVVVGHVANLAEDETKVRVDAGKPPGYSAGEAIGILAVANRRQLEDVIGPELDSDQTYGGMSAEVIERELELRARVRGVKWGEIEVRQAHVVCGGGLEEENRPGVARAGGIHQGKSESRGGPIWI